MLTQLKPKNIDDIIAAIALYRPGPMDFIPQYVKGKNSGEEITTGYDYFFYKVEKGKPVMQSVTYIEIALILPHGSDVTIKIDTSELSDGEYIVKKMFPDVDYTSEVSFRIENGVLIFPGK